MNFMRLSSMKAAHAVVAWCRVQEIRGPGFRWEKTTQSTASSLYTNWETALTAGSWYLPASHFQLFFFHFGRYEHLLKILMRKPFGISMPPTRRRTLETLTPL